VDQLSFQPCTQFLVLDNRLPALVILSTKFTLVLVAPIGLFALEVRLER